jgi:hypothetical protein
VKKTVIIMASSLNFKPLDIPTGNTFDFANSFDGTDIPPPPPSPPPVIKNNNGALSSHPTTPTNGDAEMKDANHNGASSTMPPPAKNLHISPVSPTSTTGGKRPSSVRKLLSLRSLREKDRNVQQGAAGTALASPVHSKLSTSDWDTASRPGSPYGTTASIMSDGSRPSLAQKRSSGWFGSRRKSAFISGNIDENSVPNGGAVQPVSPSSKPRGPPPPTIPEFQEFGSINGALSGGSLGADDLFKDIK